MLRAYGGKRQNAVTQGRRETQAAAGGKYGEKSVESLDMGVG